MKRDLRVQSSISVGSNACFSLKVESFIASLESTESREPPAEKIDPSIFRIQHLYPYITQQQKEDFTSKLKVS